MERIEPTFVPEWYKGSNSTVTGNGNSNHQNGSSQLDVQNVGFSLRSRLPASNSDYDASRSSFFSERTSSSFWRSASSNGYIGRDKDSSSRAYNGFSRSHHDWDRDRGKDLEIHRDIALSSDKGFGDYPDVLIPSESKKDISRRSQSFLSGKRSDSWLKKAGYDPSNGVQSVGSRINGINKFSFEKEFPSLVAEEKHVGSELPRVSSPGLNSAIHSLPGTASSIIGTDGWTSVLAEVPSIVGETSFDVSSAVQSSHALAPNVSSTSTGLNMAETVAQPLVRSCAAPSLPGESQKIEELHRQQILKLRPMTPSMPKNLGLNLAEKSKTKGAKLPEFSSAKLGQHSSAQLVNHTFRSYFRSDAPKLSQPGNFQVLNREKIDASTIEKDNSQPRTDSRIATIPPLKGQVNPKLLNVDGRTSALTSISFGEKKLPSQAQNRNDFFNSLRKKTSSSSQENISQDSSCRAPAPNSQKFDDASEKAKDVSSLICTTECSVENGNCSESSNYFYESEQLVPDEEEEAFLRSLGWEENDREEALTREEIESFLSEYEKRMPASKLKIADWSTKLSSSGAEVEASFC
ncbi:hypothetical protein KSP39_PZI016968 [Platanthera zijinensis]|uniref:Uncharacterized protein n=1 Tax=Platanthera zijinensis TaxID=2320716 RepID=A0AAP0G0B2_9ASPA